MKVRAATSSSLMTETVVSADLARSSGGELLELWKATNDLLCLLEAEAEIFWP